MDERRTRISELEQMAALDPDDSLLWFMLGSERLKAGAYEPALQALRRTLTLNPRHTAAARLVADALRLSGQTEAARAAYQAAITLAESTGDLQVAKEARTWLKKI